MAAERAHPDVKGFKDKFFGLIKSKYKKNLFDRYLFCNNYIKDKIVLDIPCGVGWGTSMLEGWKELYGVDISEDAVNEAEKKYEGIDFRQGSMTRLDFDDKNFDVVICLEGFEHITFLEGQSFLAEARRVLKDGGLLILTTPLLREDKYHSGNIYHLCEYKEEELYETLAKYYFKEKIEDEEDLSGISEGDGAAAVQVCDQYRCRCRRDTAAVWAVLYCRQFKVIDRYYR